MIEHFDRLVQVTGKDGVVGQGIYLCHAGHRLDCPLLFPGDAVGWRPVMLHVDCRLVKLLDVVRTPWRCLPLVPGW